MSSKREFGGRFFNHNADVPSFEETEEVRKEFFAEAKDEFDGSVSLEETRGSFRKDFGPVENEVLEEVRDEFKEEFSEQVDEEFRAVFEEEPRRESSGSTKFVLPVVVALSALLPADRAVSQPIHVASPTTIVAVRTWIDHSTPRVVSDVVDIGADLHHSAVVDVLPNPGIVGAQAVHLLLDRLHSGAVGIVVKRVDHVEAVAKAEIPPALLVHRHAVVRVRATAGALNVANVVQRPVAGVRQVLRGLPPVVQSRPVDHLVAVALLAHPVSAL